jgi:hypothetical protein
VRSAYGRMKTASFRSSSDGCAQLSYTFCLPSQGACHKRHMHHGTLLFRLVSWPRQLNDTELASDSLNVKHAGMQVLPMMVLLFVVVVIIILRAAWKPLPVPDAAQREALLNKAKQQAG